MMNKITQGIAVNSAIEVLEQFAFMFADYDSINSAEAPRGDFLHACMTFEGKEKGAISVTAREILCREMAANVLGLYEEEVPEGAQEDVLKELLNIVCGKLTYELYGEETVVDLTPPSVYRVGRQKWSELLASEDHMLLSVDDEPILLDMCMSN